MTRNSFKRKVIVFGIMIFASIALISTGFAAWIISQNDAKDKDINIEVGVVTDNRIGISEISFVGEIGTFYFEPSSTTVTDIVHRNTGDKAPNLEVTITATITNYSALKTLTVELKGARGTELPGEEATGIKKAAKAGYIVLPECANGPVELVGKEGVFAPNTELNQATLTYKIEFAWGEAFGNVNPSDYFDGTTEKKSDNAFAALTAFRTALCGNNEAATSTIPFTIILEASAE